MRTFSVKTLELFEAASASIPLRPLDRAFENAGFRLGKDPGGPDGARRAQFRRYVATVDQSEAQQLERLGDVLGSLIDEVATSKQAFLVDAAERDGFAFAGGAFRQAATAPDAFAVTRAEDLASIDDLGRRLQRLANAGPAAAIAGATELVDSVCRTVLQLSGKPSPKKAADLADVAKSTLDALEPVTAAGGQARKNAALLRTCLAHLGAVVDALGAAQSVSPRHARLAAGAAVTFAGFIAETYLERTASKK